MKAVDDRDCPNVSAAREALLQALTRLGMPVAWTEWDRAAPESPAYVQAYGSPTILVDGKDLANAHGDASAACRRVYGDAASGFRGAPFAYGGVAVLFGASLWNAWPQRAATGGSCAACVPENPPPNNRAHEMEAQP